MFLKNEVFRRIISLLTCFCLLLVFLSPTLAQPAEAIALVDDAALAVGLLFLTWAGVTFATNQDAVNAVSGFLQKSSTVAGQIASVVSSCVAGDQIYLSYKVKQAFADILPEIQDSFLSDESTFTGTFEPLSIGQALPFYESYDDVSIASLVSPHDILALSFNLSDGSSFVATRRVGTSFYYFSDYNDRYYVSFPINACGVALWYNSSSSRFSGFYYSNNGTGYASGSWSNKYNSDVVSITIVEVATIDFAQSTEVDGTSALKELEKCEIIEFPGSGSGDDSDPDDSGFDIKNLPKLTIAGAMAAVIGGSSNDVDEDGNPIKEADPGLDPEQMVGDLQDALSDLDADTDTNPNPDTDSSGSGTSNSDIANKYETDWKEVFPFCVPFDLIEFLGVLSAEPEAPVIKWRFYVPKIVDQEIEIDLSVFDEVAQIMRTLELLSFCIGLILLTRNIIRG